MSSLASNYINQLDSFIKSNAATVTCKELASLYFDFIEAVTLLGGKTTNLTGLTEFIVKRAYECLNEEVINRDGLILRQNVTGTKRKPDIVVYKGSKPIKSIEVKSIYSNAHEDYSKHGEVYQAYPDIVTCTIAFGMGSGRSNMIEYLERKDYYQCFILNESNNKFIDELDKHGLMLK